MSCRFLHSFVAKQTCLGDPIDYKSMVISLRTGMEKSRDDLIAKLVEIQYERNDINFIRNKFRVRGDIVEIFPVYSNDTAIRVEFFGDEIDRISEIYALTASTIPERSRRTSLPPLLRQRRRIRCLVSSLIWERQPP